MLLTHFQPLRLAVLLTLGGVFGGCCAAPAQGTTAVQQRATAPTEAGLVGQLPRAALELATPDRQVRRLRLRVNGQGSVSGSSPWPGANP